MDPKWTFEPGDVPERVELPAYGVEHTDRSKSEFFVKRERGGIGQADARDDRVDVLAFECGEQRGIKCSPTATSTRLWMTVHTGLDGRVVRKLRTPSTAAGVSKAPATVVNRHEQSMRAHVAVIVEPRSTL